MKRSNVWRLWLPILVALGLLLGVRLGSVPAYAAAQETTAVGTDADSADADADDNTPSKAVRMLGFLAIFTVVCAGTAYLVMRPSLKKLKAAKAARESQPHSASASKSDS